MVPICPQEAWLTRSGLFVAMSSVWGYMEEYPHNLYLDKCNDTWKNGSAGLHWLIPVPSGKFLHDLKEKV